MYLADPIPRHLIDLLLPRQLVAKKRQVCIVLSHMYAPPLPRLQVVSRIPGPATKQTHASLRPSERAVLQVLNQLTCILSVLYFHCL